MPAISSSAPGKVILFGEHAVVYGRPAIAVPVTRVRAKAIVTANPKAEPGSVYIYAQAIGLDAEWRELPSDHPLAVTLQNTLQALGLSRLPACNLRISSNIPVASGLGSGAAVAVAIIRAISSFTGHPLSDDKVSAIAYETEKIHHGTPSGIDNSVVTYCRPIYYVRGHPIELLRVAQPFSLVIGNTGMTSPTVQTVGAVRRAWQANPDLLEPLFDKIGDIAKKARTYLDGGQIKSLGPLMNSNHQLLRELGLSCPELDRLVEAALEAGALGAKLSGGGVGGNMIALVTDDRAAIIANALQQSGATQTIYTEVKT